MKKCFIIGMLLLTCFSIAQTLVPYQIFDKNGKKTSYSRMLTKASQNQVVLFGEHHNNSLIHWIQLRTAKDLASAFTLTLGAEMIERDNQHVLDQYLLGAITQKQMDSSARLWHNYHTDYKPLVDVAKNNGFRFVATNVPRRIASHVYHKGMEDLELTITQSDREWVAPLPIPYDENLPGYVKMKKMVQGHGGENFPKSQAIKDATMAHSIVTNLRSGEIFLHFNGSYHSDNYEGIFWYLKKYDPSLRILTVSMVSQNQLKKLDKENKGLADFIIVIDQDMTLTY